MLILFLCFGATWLNLEQKTHIIIFGRDQKLLLWKPAGVYATGAWAPEDYGKPIQHYLRGTWSPQDISILIISIQEIQQASWLVLNIPYLFLICVQDYHLDSLTRLPRQAGLLHDANRPLRASPRFRLSDNCQPGWHCPHPMKGPSEWSKHRINEMLEQPKLFTH